MEAGKKSLQSYMNMISVGYRGWCGGQALGERLRLCVYNVSVPAEESGWG